MVGQRTYIPQRNFSSREKPRVPRARASLRDKLKFKRKPKAEKKEVPKESLPFQKHQFLFNPPINLPKFLQFGFLTRITKGKSVGRLKVRQITIDQRPVFIFTLGENIELILETEFFQEEGKKKPQIKITKGQSKHIRSDLASFMRNWGFNNANEGEAFVDLVEKNIIDVAKVSAPSIESKEKERSKIDLEDLKGGSGEHLLGQEPSDDRSTEKLEQKGKLQEREKQLFQQLKGIKNTPLWKKDEKKAREKAIDMLEEMKKIAIQLNRHSSHIKKIDEAISLQKSKL